MSRRPALLTQADVARAIRAAKQEGAAAIEIRSDGSMIIKLVPTFTESTEDQVEPSREIVL